MAARSTLRTLAVLGACTRHAAAWWSEGTLPTSPGFALYIGKFCYDFASVENETDDRQSPAVGRFQLFLSGHVQDSRPGNGSTGMLHMLVFSDQRDHWMRVRPFWDELSCQERIELSNWDVALGEHLREPGSYWNTTVTVHQRLRPRFWYFTFVNCGANIVEPVSFSVHAVNADQGLEAEFSLDVQGSVYLEVAFSLLFGTVLVVLCFMGSSRTQGGRTPPLLRLLGSSATCSTAGCCCRAFHHLIFMTDGHGVIFLAVLGTFCACLAKAVLTILQFTVAKGWGVFFAPSEWSKRVVVLGALTVIVCLSVGCEIWEQYFHDQSTAFYHYESWPGRTILTLNLFVSVISLVLMWETFSRETHWGIKRFYIFVTLACFLYFASVPVVCLLAEVLLPWVRRKIVERVEMGARFGATVLLLICLRPSHIDHLIASRLKNGDQPQLLSVDKLDEES